MNDTERSISEAAFEGLLELGVSALFGMPGGGESLETIAAAERSGVPFYLLHSETSACIAAGVYGLLAGEPGVCLVTRGPGLASAVNGLAQATLDRAPLILLAETVSLADSSRIAHQKIDQLSLAHPVTKWSGTLGASGARKTVIAAASVAVTAPAGAVYLGFDKTQDLSSIPKFQHAQGNSDLEMNRQIQRACKLLEVSERPILILGAEAWAWADQLREIFEHLRCPVLTTYQARGLISDESSWYAGVFTNGASERSFVGQADVLVLLGLDPIELLPGKWEHTDKVICVMPWEVEDTFFKADVHISGPLDSVARSLGGVVKRGSWKKGAAERERVRSRDLILNAGNGSGNLKGVDPREVATLLNRHTGDLKTVTVDAGAHMLPTVPLVRIVRDRGLLISNGLATMGYALPAAIGAALARPGERVFAITGDGGIAMALADLETVVRLNLDVTIMVLNDAQLSLIEIKRESDAFCGEAVTFNTIDFAGVATAMGMNSHIITTQEGLDRVLSSVNCGPCLLDIRIDPSCYRDLKKVLRDG